MIEVPAGVRTDWTSVEARVVMIRGLIETCGPVTASAIAQRLHMTERQAFASLEALEGEGLVLRGRFESVEQAKPEPQGERWASALRCETHEAGGCYDLPVSHSTETNSTTGHDSPEQSDSEHRRADAHRSTEAPTEPEIEWCHRRLLSRIHRLTISGLRAQIEPVDITVFWRFLFEHHEIGEQHAREGVNAVFDAVAKLQGVEVPAAAWEQHVLFARVANYRSAWLDELCLNGEVGWGRLSPSKPNPESNGNGSVTKVAPVSVWLRSDLDWLKTCSASASTDDLSEQAAAIFEAVKSSGAVFAADLLRETNLPLPELRNGLSELANRGLLTSDGFAGLRSLIKITATDAEPTKRRSLVRSRSQNATKGRWSLWRQPGEMNEPTDEDVEQWAWQLLRRWGVVFRDLLNKENNAPRWYRLLQAFRRLEARGEIRGGRFITGVAGEQFAAADTVKRLRQLRSDGFQPSPRATCAQVPSPPQKMLKTEKETSEERARGSQHDSNSEIDDRATPNSGPLTPTLSPGCEDEELGTSSRGRSGLRAGRRLEAVTTTRVDAPDLDADVVVLSAADPLNLIGIITSDPKVPRKTGNKIAFLNGVPVAALNAGEVVPIGGSELNQIAEAALRSRVPASV